MIQVAVLTSHFTPVNGYGRVTQELIGRMPGFGIEPTLFVPVQENVESSGIGINPDIPMIRLSAMPVKFGGKSVAGQVRMAIEAASRRKDFKRFQLIHCLTESVFAYGNIASLLSRRPLSLTVHGTYAETSLDSRDPFVGLAYRRARFIHAPSRYTANRLIQRRPILRERIHAIPWGVTLPASRNSIAPAARREPAFLMVGAVKPRKGVLETIRALKLLLRRFPVAQLYVIGELKENTYVDHVRAAIEEEGVNDHVHLLGQVPERTLAELYGRVRGLVMPSLNVKGTFEGFGLVFLEANAHGVPSIGSLNSGNEDAIRHGTTGFLIEQADIVKLAETMGRLLQDDDEWDRMSLYACEYASEMTWDRVTEAYANMFRAAAGV